MKVYTASCKHCGLYREWTNLGAFYWDTSGNIHLNGCRRITDRGEYEHQAEPTLFEMDAA